MSPAASFGQRWATDNLNHSPTREELAVLNLFPVTCNGDETEASKRARRYYTARGPGGLTELWHKRHPDDEDILSSCQDAYIVPLRVRSVGGRRITLVRLPAPTALDRPISARALLARWLMMLDIRLREDPTPGDEVVFIDVSDLQPSHLKNHFKGSYWKDFVGCLKRAYPLRLAEVHVINAQRLKTMSLLLLHIGLYPWRRKMVHIHSNDEEINQVMELDYYPTEGLPHEYGGKAGAMKDLNDEWTKKLLSNSKWLQSEERYFYEAELKPELRSHTRHRSAMRTLREPVQEAKMSLEQPAGEMWQKIREELNEKVDTRDADLAHIKEWLKKEPHLPDEFDDQRIMTFLRGCKFSLEKTKRKLDMYFTMRAAVPEFFNDRDVTRPELQEILNIVQMPPLPGITPEGRRVIIMRGLDKDVQTPNVADAFKLALMLGDVRLAEEKEGVAGDVYILDASVATPTHFAKFTPTLVKKFLVCVQEAYPVKLKQVHVINVSPLVDKIVNFVKPFIKDKIKERIFLHTDTNELYKHVPKEMLPAEYGGNAGPMNDLHNAWVKKLEEYKDWFAEQENLKANEALRPGKPTNYDELFGIDGSFRQLVID